MHRIKVIRLNKNERQAIIKEHSKVENPASSIDDIIESNENQTLAVLRQLKGLYKWNDIEEMVDFVSILKKFETKLDFIELGKEQLDLVQKVFKFAVKSEKVSGFALEKVVETYLSFKETV